MSAFIIGVTDFGVDIGESRLEVTKGDGALSLTVEIVGDKTAFDRAVTDDDAWSWALYPPRFYLRELPISTQVASSQLTLSLADGDDHETALYMMEHNPVRDLTIKFLSPSKIQIDGRVDLLGDEKAFRIQYESA